MLWLPAGSIRLLLKAGLMIQRRCIGRLGQREYDESPITAGMALKRLVYHFGRLQSPQTWLE